MLQNNIVKPSGRLSSNKTIIFSDIDGTFIDEQYRILFSNQFLSEVFIRYDIVFISSRTISEILQLQKIIGYQFPFIAENGSVIVFPSSFITQFDTQQMVIFGETVKIVEVGNKIIDFKSEIMSIIEDLQLQITTMADLPTREVAKVAGYSVLNAHLAMQRFYSLAIAAQGIPPLAFNQMISNLEKKSITCCSGGLWHIFTQNATKGRAIKKFFHILQPNYTTVVGIGNFQNDLDMLESVDLPFVINNKGLGYFCSEDDLPNAFFLKSEGVMGWVEMIEELTFRDL